MLVSLTVIALAILIVLALVYRVMVSVDAGTSEQRGKILRAFYAACLIFLPLSVFTGLNSHDNKADNRMGQYTPSGAYPSRFVDQNPSYYAPRQSQNEENTNSQTTHQQQRAISKVGKLVFGVVVMASVALWYVAEFIFKKLVAKKT
jgi:hypothetical protein